MGYYSICNYIVTNNFRHGTLRSCMPYPVTSKYLIRTIRHRGYYLLHLLNSVVQVKVFCKCKGFEKSQFYKINKELNFRCGDLVLKQNFQLSLDQSSLSYKAVPMHLQLVYWRRWRWVVFLNCNYGMLFACFDIAIESWGLFTCARATRILTARD